MLLAVLCLQVINLAGQPSARSIYRLKKGMGTESYHGGCFSFLFFIFLFPSVSFPHQASEQRDTKRGKRRSVEVTLRPGFALQLRAGASALLGEGRADTSSWRGGAGFDSGGLEVALLEGSPEEDEMRRIMSMEGEDGRGRDPTNGKAIDLPRRCKMHSRVLAAAVAGG